MSGKNGVVAHFADGRILKGFTLDFSPNRPLFHLSPVNQPGEGPGQSVRISDLKAVFFVRDLDGDPLRGDLRGFIAGPKETIHGKKIAVRFKDGELLCGYSLVHSTRKDGFFMFPADSGSNNQRIFVVSSSTMEVAEGASAEELAQRMLNSRAA